MNDQATPADRLEEDRAARRRALATDISFIVEAPAGAGKTELLTQRYLALLAVVRQPEEVLALTFTNKAATEMRDRILASLEMAARGEMPEAEHKRLTYNLASAVLERDHALAWSLLGHPGRLRITTLDALCASLARQMPYLSRFGAQPGVAAKADEHYARAARLTLDQLENPGETADIVARALSFMDNDAGRLERLIVSMLGRREQWLHELGRLDDGALRAEVDGAFRQLIGGELAEAARRLDARWQTQLMPLVRFAASQLPAGPLSELLDWQAPLTADLADLRRWQALAGLLLTGEGEARKRLDKNTGFPADKQFADQKAAMTELLGQLAAEPALVAALARLPELPAAGLSDEDWSTVDCFGRLLRLAAAQLWLVFQESGEVDFAEISIRAALALGEEEAPTDLAQALDYRISHLLVDEFQDTSPLQVELLEKLTRGWQPGDGRTLFLVGDPMQSIYRFRKAEVGLFLQARADGIGDIALENLRLFRNNRSYPAVVDWVNEAFPGIFPADDDRASGAVRYAASAATRPAEASSAVRFHPVLVDRADDADLLEARQILALIQAARRERPNERIAVLVRARSHLDALVAEIRLQAPELRYQAVEIESLANRQPIQDLLSLQQALWHRADRVHWLAILRAPWCGLTLADLHALAGDDRQATVWQLMHDAARLARLSDDGQARLGHLRTVLASAFAQRGRQHPRRWLEGTWLMLGGASTLHGASDLADVEAFFTLLDELAATGQLNGDTLLARAGELFAPPDPLASEQVQMMTIHKSKGLEFETVILPGLHRNSGQNEQPLLLWDTLVDAHGAPRLLVAPLPRRGADKAAPSPYRLLNRLESRRAGHEDARLLYVGVTRAIRCLHLVGVVEKKPEAADGLAAPRQGSLLDLLWPGLAHGASLAALATLAEGASPAPEASLAGAFIPRLVRLRSPAVPPELRPQPVDVGEDNPQVNIASTLNLAAAVGTLVHRCLELIAGDGCAAWPAARIAGQHEAYRRHLESRGFSRAEAESGAAETVHALHTTLGSPAGRWLLAEHAEADAEQGWSSRDESGTSNHVIDRIFIADGVRWIVDYKTLRGDGSLDLAAAAASHRAQLSRYASLFADDPRPTRLAIFFPLQGELVELD